MRFRSRYKVFIVHFVKTTSKCVYSFGHAVNKWFRKFSSILPKNAPLRLFRNYLQKDKKNFKTNWPNFHHNLVQKRTSFFILEYAIKLLPKWGNVILKPALFKFASCMCKYFTKNNGVSLKLIAKKLRHLNAEGPQFCVR